VALCIDLSRTAEAGFAAQAGLIFALNAMANGDIAVRPTFMSNDRPSPGEGSYEWITI
jgi:hypothetical protein